MEFEDIQESVEQIQKLTSCLQGKMIFDFVKEAEDHTFICEVGTYFGYISAVMGHACKETNKRVLMIDHMIGGMCDFQEGTKCIYLDVIDNMVQNGVWDKIIPLPMKSKDALEILDIMNPKISVLYLDGDHNRDNVLYELEHFDKFIVKGGIVCGDDCDIKGLTLSDFWDMFVRKIGITSNSVLSAICNFFGNNADYEMIPCSGNQFAFRKVV